MEFFRRFSRSLHRNRSESRRRSSPLPLLLSTYCFLGVIVVLPLAAITLRALDVGILELLRGMRNPHMLYALKLTLMVSFAVMVVNVVTGTFVAWVLVRYDFPGKKIMNALIDVPFAIPTVVTGLMLLSVYGPEWILADLLEKADIQVVFAKPGIVLALLIVTFPFVIRSVQPVLMAADPRAEEAAATLGASRLTTFLRVILPPILPSILMGAALSFSRALGEFGSVIVVAGNIPMKTQLAPVYIYAEVESGNMSSALALSVVLLALSMVLLVIFKLFERLAGAAPEMAGG
jgi:sulfate transport system permease protein